MRAGQGYVPNTNEQAIEEPLCLYLCWLHNEEAYYDLLLVYVTEAQICFCGDATYGGFRFDESIGTHAKAGVAHL